MITCVASVLCRLLEERERSRDPESIVAEAEELFNAGYKEVTLLGQNVDSYLWGGGGLKKDILARGDLSGTVSFAELLVKVAEVHPDLRVRFSTSHPKDMHDDVLHAMAKYENICSYIHLPVQSGSTRLLELMNRGYIAGNGTSNAWQGSRRLFRIVILNGYHNWILQRN